LRRSLLARQHRLGVATTPCGKDRERNRSDNEDNRRPGSGLGQNSSRAARAESCLAALTAKGGSDVATLAALQQDDANQEEANNYVNNRDENNHVSLWCGRGDLNPHALRRHPLKMVCLPIPPLPQYFLLNQSLVEAGEGPTMPEGQPQFPRRVKTNLGLNNVTVTGPTPAMSQSENWSQRTEN